MKSICEQHAFCLSASGRSPPVALSFSVPVPKSEERKAKY
ncbi:hypothetical protein [Thermomicrobium sp. CFH 73360]